MTNKEKIKKIFVNNSTPTIQEEVIILRIENAELKAQIEKMKLCENCKHWVEPFESECICIDCHKMNKWEVNNV